MRAPFRVGLLTSFLSTATLCSVFGGDIPFTPPQTIPGEDSRIRIRGLVGTADFLHTAYPVVIAHTVSFDQTDLVFWWNYPPLRQDDIYVLGGARADDIRATALGDIDGDGREDILFSGYDTVVNAGEPRNSISWNSPLRAGGLIADIALPGSLDTADINGDGNLDVIGGGSGSANWYKHPGDLSVEPWTEHVIDAPTGFLQVAAGDVDGDGDEDVVGVGGLFDPGYHLTWWENTDHIGQTWSTHLIDGSLLAANRELQLADLDLDGDLDVVALLGEAPGLGWWENRAGGALWIPHTFPSGYALGSRVSVLDADRDGDPDLIFSRANPAGAILWRNDRGAPVSWTRQDLSPEGDGCLDMLVDDLDKDGDIDLIYRPTTTTNLLRLQENRLVHANAFYPEKQRVAAAQTGGGPVATGDLNGDGLDDVVGVAPDDHALSAWLNVDGSGSLWWNVTLDTSITGVTSFVIIDLDRDGDLDVVGAVAGEDRVCWWENDGEHLPAWTRHTLTSGYDARHIQAGDLDGDGDPDVAATSYDGDTLTWWESDGIPSDGGWIPHEVSRTMRGPASLLMVDLDRDGDLDLAGTGSTGGRVLWWENTDIAGTHVFWPHVVQSDLTGLATLCAGDWDRDGDIDLAAIAAGEVLWWENDDGEPPAWTPRLVTSSLGYLVDMETGDLDHDGDLDLAGISYQDQRVVWMENGDERGVPWTQRELVSGLPNGTSIDVGDLNQDGKLDLVTSSGDPAHGTALWFNWGGQVSFALVSPSVISAIDGQASEVLAVQVEHEGRYGDPRLELSEFRVQLRSQAGTPVSTPQLAQAVTEWVLYLDDRDGVWDAGDAEIGRLNSTAVSQGVLSFVLPSGTIDLGPGGDVLFFVVAQATVNASGLFPAPLFMSLQMEDTAHDVEFNLPLAPEWHGPSEVVLEFSHPLPDLRPLACETEALVATTEQRVTLDWAVINSGPEDAESNWHDQLFISDDATWDTGDTPLQWVGHYDDVPPGEIYTNHFTFTVPQFRSGGRYLIHRADQADYVVEASELNNASAVPFFIQTPDLHPVDLTVPPAAATEARVDVSWIVENLGNGTTADGWHDQLYLSSDEVLDAGDPSLTWVSGPSELPPGGRYTNATSFVVPSLPAGTYFLLLKADDYEYLFEEDESNNLLATGPFEIQTPDLHPVELFAPPSAVSEARVDVSWIVENLGNGTTADGWHDQLYLSSDEVLDAGDPSLTWVSGPSELPPGGRYTNATSFVVPSLPAGTYFLLLKADDYEYLFEEDESNNLLTAVPFEIRTPDLLPVELTAPPSATTEARVDVSWIVENLGNGATAPGWHDQLYLSSDEVLDAGDPSLTWVAGPGEVLPGGQYTNASSFTVPSLPAGVYFLLLKADNGDLLFEEDESNNLLTAAFDIDEVIAPFYITDTWFIPPDTAALVFSTDSVHTYRIETCGNITSLVWQTTPCYLTLEATDPSTNFLGNGGERTIYLSPIGERVYYRVVLEAEDGP